MNKTLRVLSVLTIGVLSLVVAVPVALYILLSTPWAQNRLCELAENELGALLARMSPCSRSMFIHSTALMRVA